MLGPSASKLHEYNDLILQDELLWGAAWLHKASRRRVYREYIVRNEVVLRAGDTINEFGWDNKHAGINVLISKVFMLSKANLNINFLINFFLLLNDYINNLFNQCACLYLCFYCFCLYALVWNVATISLFMALMQT